MLKVYGRSSFPHRPDIATIRTKHRLCVPMVLLPEEVVLLAHFQPSVAELQRVGQLQLVQLAAAAQNSPGMSEEAVKKRKERELKKAAAAAKAAEAEDAPPADTLYTVVIPASSTSFEWYNDNTCLFTTIQAAKEAEYGSIRQSARTRQMWCSEDYGTGDVQGGGIKFGGDYLGSLRYHAHFSATVLESPTFSLTPME
ncbi:hypothetical protein B0H13DRAFT_2062079, partial [Mycena leptocephala]